MEPPGAQPAATAEQTGIAPVAVGAAPGSTTPASLARFARPLALLVLLGLLCAVPFLAPSDRAMRIILLIGIYVILASGLNILVGYTGLLDLGYIAFFAIGAYTSGLITVRVIIPRVGLETYAAVYWWFPYLDFVIAGLVAACVAGILGYPTLRARGDYLAIMTLGLGEIVRLVAVNWQGLTRGPAGIPGIPSFAFFDFEIYDPRYIYFVLLIVGLLTVVIIRQLVNSYLGRAWMTIREDQLVAETMGIRSVRYKLLAYMTGGLFAGMVGVVFAHQQNFINPDSFVLNENFVVLAILILGGSGTLLGPIVGGIVWITFDQTLATTPFVQQHPEMRQIVLGALVLVILRFASGGIVRRVDPLIAGLLGLPARARRIRSAAIASIPPGGATVVDDAVPESGPSSRELPPAIRVAERHQLAATDISVIFGGLHALNGVGISVASQEIVGLIGPNGAGKTTLINVLTGVYRASSGALRLDGEVISFRSPADAAARRLSRTFQTIRILPEMTVLENVLVGAHNHVTHGPLSALGLRSKYASEGDAQSNAVALLEWVGLGERSREAAGSLPYGLQRRLEVARALMTRPWFLFLDEPAAGMNPRETDQLKALIRDISDAGIGVLLVEHDMRLLMSVSDRVVVLSQGMPLTEGLPEEVARDAAVIEAYLGSEDEEQPDEHVDEHRRER